MKQSTRLILNATSMLGRLGFTLCIGLVVTRLLLRTLGPVDFGLVVALGATGAMLEFITAGMTTSVQRQLSYEVGRKEAGQVNQAFTTAWLTFVTLAAFAWIVGEALTPVVMNVLTIPPDRADAAWWVYQCTLITLVLAITATPYHALVVANQHVYVTALADSLTSLLRLGAVLTVIAAPWDRMVTYAALQLAGLAVVRWGVALYCLLRLTGARPKLANFDRAHLKQMANLAGWTMVGDLSWRLRMQGGTVLLNIFFGPIINSGYGIAVQIGGYIMQVAQAMRLAVLPAIVGAEESGNRQNLHRLVLVAGKYVVLVVSLLIVPLGLEAEQALALWLDEVPPYTVVFTRLVMIWCLGYVLTIGHNMALLAGGDIGWYTRQTALNSFAVLFAAAAGFYFGLPPWFLPVATIIGVAWLLVIAVWGIGAEIGLPPIRWMRESFVPAISAIAIASAGALAVRTSMSESVWRMPLVAAAYAIVALPVIWFYALAGWEREQFARVARTAYVRLRGAV
jgi:O-antigen/teichoic acid export membrane protein